MSEKENAADSGPLYKRMHGYDVQPWTYKCTVSGSVCERVTKYFQDYAAFVKRMSDNNDNGIFLTQELNLCTDPNYFGRCTVYDNFMKTVTKFAKNNER